MRKRMTKKLTAHQLPHHFSRGGDATLAYLERTATIKASAWRQSPR